MKQLTLRLIVALGTVFVTAVPSVQATSITFNFNALADAASNATVQTNMRATITAALPGQSVTVTGSQAEKDYTGDNHVVGPVSGTTVTSETLGTSDLGVHHNGGLDTFLINRDGYTTITMTFTFPIYAVSFDYEIFPNSLCATGSCGLAKLPDFTFEANDVVVFHTFGGSPSSPYTHSPISGSVNNELTPQYLGQSGQRLFSGGVTKLEFIDWPVRIGIDNLVVDNVRVPGGGTGVPEPGTLLLFGSGMITAVVARRLRKRG